MNKIQQYQWRNYSGRYAQFSKFHYKKKKKIICCLSIFYFMHTVGYKNFLLTLFFLTLIDAKSVVKKN